ncbi:Uncharacterized protein TCM_023145 [Theobroma cacao]|uniref:Uncharacterized protein n=1 Tax=Theobroma cacao TaxID=3641 RepID=A0A061F227_THECC|nr:Uncharacterized protein TCM_023145 [Theobroma cacao]
MGGEQITHNAEASSGEQIIDSSKLPMSTSPRVILTDGIKALHAGITSKISATVPTYHHPYKHTHSHKGTEIHSTANQINVRNSSLG